VQVGLRGHGWTGAATHEHSLSHRERDQPPHIARRFASDFLSLGQNEKNTPQRENVSRILLGHSKLESTVRYLGIEVDDALEIAEQIDV